MKLYPKIIPAIAPDVIASLMAEGDIEVETMRVADAEMDMAAILKEYLAFEERVNQATREALRAPRIDCTHASNQVKREMADVRGSRWATRESTTSSNQMIEFLLISRNMREVFAEDHTIRRRSTRSSRSTWTSTRTSTARRAPPQAPLGRHPGWEVDTEEVEQIRRNKGW